MKKVVFLALATLFAASMAFAQAGSIGIFGDQAGTNCNLPDVAPASYHYVVHVNSGGATACQFSAPKPTCFTGNYFADQAVFGVTVGNSQTGVSVGYGTCLAGNIHVLTIVFFASGTTGPCCYYPVLPDPAVLSGKVQAVDCFDSIVYPTAGVGIINSQPNCNCNVPAEDTTWGKVKSLYE